MPLAAGVRRNQHIARAKVVVDNTVPVHLCNALRSFRCQAQSLSKRLRIEGVILRVQLRVPRTQ